MKTKIGKKSIFAVLIISLIAIMAFALAQNTNTETQINEVSNSNFIDEDNDSICDNKAECPFKESGAECPMKKYNTQSECPMKKANTQCPMKNNDNQGDCPMKKANTGCPRAKFYN
jgi:hypothetical protein